MSNIDEKHAVDHIQDHEAIDKRLSHSSDDDILAEFTPEEIKKVIHRIDRRLVVTVGLMYCVSLMDRTNLSAAAIAGYVMQARTDGYGMLIKPQHERGTETDCQQSIFNCDIGLLHILHRV